MSNNNDNITTAQKTEESNSESTQNVESSPPEASDQQVTPRNASLQEKTEPQERSVRGFRWFLVCLSIFSANLLFGLDNTIAADIQGAVAETYQNTGQLGWLGVGFTLGSAAGILPIGKSYAIFDNRWVFIACLANFAAASALCGAAPNMNAMIVGRVWAGFGGSGMYLGTLNISTALVLPKEQPVYVAGTGFIYGAGAILGPVVGGLLADSPATWRWAFYLNLVIFGAMSPIYVFLVPSVPRRPEMSFLEKAKLMDWLGILLNSAMYSCFTVAFLFGGVEWAWNDGRTITLIVLAFVLLIAFVLTQKFAILTDKVNRLFPCSFLRNPQLVLMYILMFCSGLSLFVAVYYIPFYYLFARGESGTQAAVRLLPYICFYVAAILICGAVMGRVGYHIVWFLLSGLFLTAGSAAMYTVDPYTSNAKIIGFSILLAVGMTASQAPYAIGHLLVEPELAADLIQYINISQGSSQLVGLVIASAIFQAEAFSGIRAILPADRYTDADIQAAVAGARSEVLTQASPEIRAAAIAVIVEAIDKIWILVIAASAIFTICTLFLTRERFVKPKGRHGEDSGPAMMIF
ncbi:MFS general substrate transporter [Daldinia vernicosa]|uniref:MFS general substrate transporter n=1 Tax=Daldinia vernicosa TaxID=114800 RepID=UPI0020084789|nr:MFS general substrate transporter [Daldinia vernicosa]KAI0844847.1 MFS general substrate transporter [Daldinia vernicosa]